MLSEFEDLTNLTACMHACMYMFMGVWVYDRVWSSVRLHVRILVVMDVYGVLALRMSHRGRTSRLPKTQV